MQVNIGKGLEIDIDAAALPEAAMQHVIYIGLRNILMDSHASITKETNPDDLSDAAEAMARKKLDALMRGEVRVASSREGDPVRAEAIRMASDIIKSALRKKGTKISDVEPKAIREAAVKLLATDRGADISAKAKARVDEQRSASEVDLSDLGL
jgi:hypothetical protein